MNDWLITLNDFSSAWAQAILRACWQGGLAILLVWCLCRLLKRMPPAAKCWLWRLAYLKLFVALAWPTAIALPLLPAHAPQAESVGAGRATGSEALSSLLLEGDRRDSKTASEQELATGLPASSERVLPKAASWLLAAWLLAAGWSAMRVLQTWRGVGHVLANSRPAGDRHLTTKLAMLSRELGLRRAPSLRTSDAIGGPLLLGVIRPAIVLPNSLVHACGPAELRLALTHELAHLRRRDLLWNWLPTLAEVVFFFHPAVWLARREWLLAQELACDETAARVSRSTAAEMGRLLLRIASHGRSGFSDSLLTAEVSTSFSQVRRRLIAMKGSSRLHRKRRMLAIAAVCLLVGAATLVPWRVTARESRDAEATLPTSVLSSEKEAGESPVSTPAAPTGVAGKTVFSGPAARGPDHPRRAVERYQRVAVVDMQYLFHHGKAFADSIAGVKRQHREAEAEARKAQDEIRRASGRLAHLRAGTPEHGELEKEITLRQAELQAELELSRKRLQRLEASVYEATYDDIVDAVARFAERHDVDAVYRKEVSVDPPKSGARATSVRTTQSEAKSGRTTADRDTYASSVIRRINRQVVYRRDEWDITSQILEMLDRPRAEPESDEGPDDSADVNR